MFICCCYLFLSWSLCCIGSLMHLIFLLLVFFTLVQFLRISVLIIIVFFHLIWVGCSYFINFRFHAGSEILLVGGSPEFCLLVRSVFRPLNLKIMKRPINGLNVKSSLFIWNVTGVVNPKTNLKYVRAENFQNLSECQNCLNIAVLITNARHNQTLKARNFLKLYKQRCLNF